MRTLEAGGLLPGQRMTVSVVRDRCRPVQVAGRGDDIDDVIAHEVYVSC